MLHTLHIHIIIGILCIITLIIKLSNKLISISNVCFLMILISDMILVEFILCKLYQ